MKKTNEEKDKVTYVDEANRIHQMINKVIDEAREARIMTPQGLAYLLAKAAARTLFDTIDRDVSEDSFVTAKLLANGVLLDAIYDGTLENLRARNEIMAACISLNEEE